MKLINLFFVVGEKKKRKPEGIINIGIGVMGVNHLYFNILPSLVLGVNRSGYSAIHWFKLELKLLGTGAAVKINWKNKHVEPLPDLSELF